MRAIMSITRGALLAVMLIIPGASAHAKCFFCLDTVTTFVGKVLDGDPVGAVEDFGGRVVDAAGNIVDAVLPSPPEPDWNPICDTYANNAVKAVQTTRAAGCGYPDFARFSGSWQAHKDFCMSEGHNNHTMDFVNLEAAKRDVYTQHCTACVQQTPIRVQQAKQNRIFSCGGTGREFSEDPAVQLQNCVGSTNAAVAANTIGPARMQHQYSAEQIETRKRAGKLGLALIYTAPMSGKLLTANDTTLQEFTDWCIKDLGPKLEECVTLSNRGSAAQYLNTCLPQGSGTTWEQNMTLCTAGIRTSPELVRAAEKRNEDAALACHDYCADYTNVTMIQTTTAAAHNCHPDGVGSSRWGVDAQGHTNWCRGAIFGDVTLPNSEIAARTAGIAADCDPTVATEITAKLDPPEPPPPPPGAAAAGATGGKKKKGIDPKNALLILPSSSGMDGTVGDPPSSPPNSSGAVSTLPGSSGMDGIWGEPKLFPNSSGAISVFRNSSGSDGAKGDPKTSPNSSGAIATMPSSSGTNTNSSGSDGVQGDTNTSPNSSGAIATMPSSSGTNTNSSGSDGVQGNTTTSPNSSGAIATMPSSSGSNMSSSGSDGVQGDAPLPPSPCIGCSSPNSSGAVSTLPGSSGSDGVQGDIKKKTTKKPGTSSRTATGSGGSDGSSTPKNKKGSSGDGGKGTDLYSGGLLEGDSGMAVNPPSGGGHGNGSKGSKGSASSAASSAASRAAGSAASSAASRAASPAASGPLTDYGGCGGCGKTGGFVGPK